MPGGYGSVGYGVGGYGGGGALQYKMPSLGYYLGLLTSEWQNSPQFLAFASLLLRPFIDLGVCLGLMDEALDLNSAVGKQLDVLGVILGQSRTVNFQPSNNVSPVLDDKTYRILLKAKVVFNQWNGQIAALYSTWASLFPGGRIVFVDNQNMTATILLSGFANSIQQDLVTNGLIIPRPQGVQYTYTFIMLPAFGVDLDNSYVSGVDSGHIA